MIPFILNGRKCKPFYNDRKQISGCLGWGPGTGRQEQWQGRVWGNAGEQCIYSRSWLWWRLHGWMHMSKRIKLYNLNKCSLLYVNYTSIKLYFLRCVFHCMKIILQFFFFYAEFTTTPSSSKKRNKQKIHTTNTGSWDSTYPLIFGIEQEKFYFKLKAV